MQLFWANILNRTIKRAFFGINLEILNIDFAYYAGHTFNTVKIKLMGRISGMYSSNDPHRDLIINNLTLMMNECDNHPQCILTSPLLKHEHMQENSPFQFFDESSQKFITIEYHKAIPYVITHFSWLQNVKYSDFLSEPEYRSMMKDAQKRSFRLLSDRVNMICYDPIFTGRSPSQAAKKAFTYLINKRKLSNEVVEGEIKFSIIECKSKKIFNYVGKRFKMDVPIVINIMKNGVSKEIIFNYKSKVVTDRSFIINRCSINKKRGNMRQRYLNHNTEANFNFKEIMA